MELLWQSKQSLSSSNSNISKEVTNSLNKNNVENNIMAMLKKLPNITVSYVNPQLVFKVPEAPKLNKDNNKKSIVPELKVFSEKNIMPNYKTKISEKKVLLERQQKDNNIKNTKPNSINNVKNLMKMNKNSKKTTINQKQKNSEAIFKKLSDKENNIIQRTSSPNKILKKSSRASKTKSKTVKPTKKTNKEISNNSIISHKAKTISDKDSIINNIEVKTNKSNNESQINFTPTYCPLDLTNLYVPNYKSFVMGIISKFPEDNSIHSETSQSYIENESLNGKELSELLPQTNQAPTIKLPHFSEIVSYIKLTKSKNQIKSNSIITDLDSGAYSVEKNVTSNNIKIEQFHVNQKCIRHTEDIINKKNEQTIYTYISNDVLKNPLLQNNQKNYTINTPILLKDQSKQHKTENYFYDSLVEKKTSENEFIDCVKPLQEILQINRQDSSNVKYDENENGIKRCKQPQNELYKKQKTNTENI